MAFNSALRSASASSRRRSDDSWNSRVRSSLAARRLLTACCSWITDEVRCEVGWRWDEKEDTTENEQAERHTHSTCVCVRERKREKGERTTAQFMHKHTTFAEFEYIKNFQMHKASGPIELQVPKF